MARGTRPMRSAKGKAAGLGAAQRLGTAATCGFPVLTLSAVARRGDIAFVEVGISGGPLSGAGEIWALRRTPDGWRTVARRRTWVS